MKVMKYINEFIKYKEYKGEKAIYRVNDNCGNTYYSDEYVNWLEFQLSEARKQLSLFGVIGSVCDCVIPKPKDPYHDLDRKICRDCNGNIEQTDL